MKSRVHVTRWVLYPATCFAWSFRGAAFSAGRPTGSRTTTRTYASVKTQTDQSVMLLGGDFAGYTAQCDPVTGVAKLVPEHLVPRSMLEWGQHPKTLEIIVSEDFAQVDDEESTIIFDRTCLTVLPEIGCGIDNLEVQTSTEPEWTVIGRNEYCIGLLRTANQAATVVETVFPSETEESHRVRVAIGLSSDTDETTAISTLSLSLERKFDDHSSSGSRADGGGLDAASVYKWMGETLAKTGSKRLGEIPESSDTPTDGRIELPLDVYVQYGKSAEIKYVSVCRNDSGSGARYEWGSAGNRPSCTLLTSTGHVPP